MAPLTAAVVVLGILGLGLVRVAAGWAPLAPDDARYLYVGLSVLDGAGPITPNGTTHLLRSPVFGVALAIGSRLAGGDPVDGARLVALGLALTALLGAIRLGWLVAGPIGAIGTAVALASTSLVWELLPSMRIDLAQAAGIVILLLVAWRPTRRRWALAGIVLGITVLIKETALPLSLLPLALGRPGALRGAVLLGGIFLAAALLTAAWWWIFVWTTSGQIFPLNAIAVVEARDVAGSSRLPWTVVGLGSLSLVGWAVVARRARREPGPRLLLVAAAVLAPAALYAALNGLGARNLVALAILSAVAIGVGAGALADRARAALTPEHRGGSRRRRPWIVALSVAVVVGAGLVVTGQRAVPPPGDGRLADALVRWIDADVPVGGRIVMPFREREVVALRRYGRTQVRSLPVRRVDVAQDPAAYVWMGLRDARLFGYPRQGWVTALTDPAADYLVAVGPHPLTPTELWPAGRDVRPLPGLTSVATLEVGTDRADILQVDAASVGVGWAEVPLHLSAAAALAWLDAASRSSGDDAAVERLVAARPVVSGMDLPALITRLGTRACVTARADGAIALAPPSTCPA